MWAWLCHHRGWILRASLALGFIVVGAVFVIGDRPATESPIESERNFARSQIEIRGFSGIPMGKEGPRRVLVELEVIDDETVGGRIHVDFGQVRGVRPDGTFAPFYDPEQEISASMSLPARAYGLRAVGAGAARATWNFPPPSGIGGSREVTLRYRPARSAMEALADDGWGGSSGIGLDFFVRDGPWAGRRLGFGQRLITFWISDDVPVQENDRRMRASRLEVSFRLPSDQQYEFNENQLSPPASTTAFRAREWDYDAEGTSTYQIGVVDTGTRSLVNVAQQAGFAALGMVLGMALPTRRAEAQKPLVHAGRPDLRRRRRYVRRIHRRQATPTLKAQSDQGRFGRRAAWVVGGAVAVGVVVVSIARRRSR